MSELEGKTKIDSTVIAAFDALKIINLESTKIAGKKDFYFLIAHRFGSVKNGFDDLFGLDQATIKFSFFYGLTDRLTLGAARSEFRKTYDLSAKYRLKRQLKNGFPFTMVSFNTIAVNTNLDKDDFPKLEFQNRLTYLTELLISRKFNKNLSLQIAPIFIHENFVSDNNQDNNQFALALGGRYRLTKSLALTTEYGHHFNRASGSLFENPVSVGLDIQVGGHVFQLIFSNSQQLNDSHYITNTTGNWFDGDFFFGFNLYRVF